MNDSNGPSPQEREFVYSLGDAGKEEHMRTFRQLDAKLFAIGQLSEKDFAFVRRSNGTWQFSMVAEIAPISDGNERCIKFLLDLAGRTKRVPARQWADDIRLVRRSQITAKKPARRRVSWAGELEDVCEERREQSVAMPVDVKCEEKCNIWASEENNNQSGHHNYEALTAPKESRCDEKSPMDIPHRRESYAGAKRVDAEHEYHIVKPFAKPTEIKRDLKCRRRASVDCGGVQLHERTFLSALAAIDRKTVAGISAC